jgi:hypothetical protein
MNDENSENQQQTSSSDAASEDADGDQGVSKNRSRSSDRERGKAREFVREALKKKVNSPGRDRSPEEMLDEMSRQLGLNDLSSDRDESPNEEENS